MDIKDKGIRIGVDIGGTFTDIVAQMPDGEVHIRKVSSTPHDPGKAVVEGLTTLIKEINAPAENIREIVHGTTVGSNTILQKKGPNTGVLTTKGFRDILEIARIRTPDMFNLQWDKPVPLSIRRFRYEVEERIAANGSIINELKEEDIIKAGEYFIENDVEAIAICFINSYANNAHEKKAKKILEQNFPELLISASFMVLPEIKEYERTSTTVVNAYLLKTMRQYLEKLNKRLHEVGIMAPLLVVTSSGGVMGVETALEKPVFLVASGPAGGVAGSVRLSKLLDQKDAIVFDMGGTTAKASIIEDGNPMITSEYEFREGISSPSRFIKGGGYLLKVPAIDISEVGAGGGSIAWVDNGGLLQVGPNSAGANPGPACYGLGNDKPTVTDANVVLGLLNQKGIAGGSLKIYKQKAMDAINKYIATPLSISVIEAANGIRTVANVAMARSIRSVTVERGKDPREMVLFAFGGGGPVHAVDVANILGIKKIVVPRMSGVFCAAGMLTSDIEHNFVKVLMLPVKDLSTDVFFEELIKLKNKGTATVSSEGIEDSQININFTADIRYLGQSSELAVRFDPEKIKQNGFDYLKQKFNALYSETFGYFNDEEIEFVNLRVSAKGVRKNHFKFEDAKVIDTDSNAAIDEKRQTYFGEERKLGQTKVIHPASLHNDSIAGPLIMDCYDTTIVVPPGANIGKDVYGNVQINIDYIISEVK